MAEHWRFVLTGGISLDDNIFNPCSEWLLDKSWSELTRLCRMEPWADIDTSFEKEKDAWRAVYESKEPHMEIFPGKYNELDAFKKIAIVRCIRPDKVIPAARDFVKESLGERFIEVPPFDLDGSFADSAPERSCFSSTHFYNIYTFPFVSCFLGVCLCLYSML